MSFDVVCACGALCDRTELGECLNGVYTSCEHCETEEQTEARWAREEAEMKVRLRVGVGCIRQDL